MAKDGTNRGRPKGRRTHPSLIERIHGEKIIQALENHIFEGEEMKMTQVKAALGLLARIMPTLARTDVTVDGELGTFAISDKPLSNEEWAKSAQDYVEATARSPETSH